MNTPIQTENAAMAIALYLAGLAPANENHFAMVVYDEKMLEVISTKIGAEERLTVEQAVEAGCPGHRVFCFDPQGQELYDAFREIWDDEKSRIEKNLPSSIEMEAADMIRLVARAFHCRKQVVEEWDRLPIYAMQTKGAATSSSDENGTKITHPGFVMVNTRASKAIHDHIDGKEVVNEEDEE